MAEATPDKAVPFIKFTPMRDPKGTPILPSPKNFATPSRQTGIEKQIEDRLLKIVRGVWADTKKILESIPVKAANASSKQYTYLVDVDDVQRITDAFNKFLKQGFLGSSREGFFDADFWGSMAVEKAYFAGVRDAIESGKRVVPANVVGKELRDAMFAITTASLAERQLIARRASIAGARIFEEMKGITDEGRSKMAIALMQGIQFGQGIEVITKEVKKAIGSTMKRATAIARTEINKAYRDGVASEMASLNDQVFNDSDWEYQLLWFSALTSRTRRWHAKRHGKTYTKAEVDKFYSEDANAINCYCSQSPVLVNRKTGEVVQQRLHQQMAEQQAEWIKKTDEKEAA